MQMKNFMYDFWNNLWKLIGTISGIVLIILIFISLSSDHKVRSYYLHQGSTGIMIYKDQDWQIDESINLDRTVSYDEALNILERLNKTIK
jgi:hypothetical protein